MDITRNNEIIDNIISIQRKAWIKNRMLGMIPDTYNNPTGAQLEITYKCNLHCKHCYNESGSRSIWRYGEEMSDQMWLDITDELIDSQIFAVIISGGEPFLKPDLVLKMIEKFDNADVKMGIISNGWFLDESLVLKLSNYKRSINWVQISVDGSNARSHDMIRGVEGSFNNSINAIVNLKKHGFFVKIATAIMPDNIDELNDIFELAIFIGANELHIGTVFDMGAAKGIQINTELSDKVLKQACELKNLYSEYIDVQISMDPYIAIQLFSQYRLNNVYIIRPNGDLKLDCIVPVIFGTYKKRGDLARNWKESGLKYAYEHKLVQQMISDISADHSLRNIKDTYI